MAKAKTSGTSLLPWLGLAAIVILLDQIAKAMIMRMFHYNESFVVYPWFNIVQARNTGAAFSFLASESGWQRWVFVGLGVVAALFIVWMLRRHGAQKLFCTALALILGGALGNVIDRLTHGFVVDFLQVHHGSTWYFPSFNLADSAITLGAVCLVLDELLRVRRGR